MNIIVTLEHRFESTPDGAVWTQTAFPYSFWQRYLEVFDRVSVVSRIRYVETPSDKAVRSDGKDVSFIPVPYYLGPWQYILKARQIKQILKTIFMSNTAVIFRVPSQIATLAMSAMMNGQPYGLEVVGDPYDVFAPGAVKHPLRPFFRYWFSYQLKKQCAKAFAIAYVTQYSLQRRYPPALNIFTTHFSSVSFQKPKRRSIAHREIPLATHYSDVELNRQNFSSIKHKFNRKEGKSFNIITIASLEQMYKGIDLLIDSIAINVRNGFNLKLTIVGDGKHRKELELRVNKHGLKENVTFLGQLPAGDPVYTQLDKSDLFVLPSRTEGMPRAMIEAMARGLPCIGSSVGGITELLVPEDMIPPGDVDALARKICEVLSDSERMQSMSERNLKKAQEYREDVLRERRLEFYNYIRQKTEEWVKIR